MRDDRVYLEDILDAIGQIEKYAARGRAAFDADELIQNWFIHYIQVIGEAAGNLSAGLKAGHPEVPWAAIKAMRKESEISVRQQRRAGSWASTSC